MPISPETPVNTTPSIANASATVTVSGSPASGTFEGPHRIERQSLTIWFMRVPGGAATFDSSCVNLSGVETSSISYYHGRTELACQIEASYSVEKVMAFYDTSTFVQPQKFTYLSLSSDLYGNSYGTSFIASACLGPMGSIITSKEWYQRTPWDDASGHTEIASSTDCRTYYASAGEDLGGGPRMVDGTKYTGEYWRWFIHNAQPNTFLHGEQDVALYNMNGMSMLHGAYNYDKENARATINFINRIGQLLGEENLYKIIADLDTGNAAGQALANTGVPGYSNARHDFD